MPHNRQPACAVGLPSFLLLSTGKVLYTSLRAFYRLQVYICSFTLSSDNDSQGAAFEGNCAAESAGVFSFCYTRDGSFFLILVSKMELVTSTNSICSAVQAVGDGQGEGR